MKTPLVIAGFFASISLFAQAFNTTLLDNWDPTSVTTAYNDVWGYTEPNGTEYVIAGTRASVHFLEINADNTLTEIHRHTPSGTNSIWRDFKTFGQYVYAVADQNSEGLLIYNMSTLPTIPAPTQITTDFVRAHNIFIDTATARLYVAGTNSGANRSGLIVYDISSPESPVNLNAPSLSAHGGYVHDVYVRNDTAYCSHGYNGFTTWDFTDPTTPVMIGSIDTGNNYNHSSWLTPDGNTIFYAEEVPAGRPITVLDISDPENYNELSIIKEPLLAPEHTNNTPHNPFLKDGFLYVSYYQDGTQIWDVRDLDNIVKVAYYDTEPDNTTYSGTVNSWGVYPYFTDNKIVASDGANGVFLIQVNDDALPLEFVDFNAVLKNKKTEISWQTTSEYLVSHFEIQRSQDGIKFETIGTHQPSNQNIGLRMYAHTDPNPHRGINYYRIKSVDLDGRFDKTTIKSILNNSDLSIRLFPNPSNGTFTIEHDLTGDITTIHIKVFDVTGQTVMDQLIPATGQGTLKYLIDVPAGSYVIELYQFNSLVWTDQLIIVD